MSLGTVIIMSPASLPSPYRKFLPTALMVTLVLFLSACGGTQGAVSSTKEGSPPPSSPPGLSVDPAPDSYQAGKDRLDKLATKYSLVEIVDVVESWGRQNQLLSTDCHGLLRHAGTVFAKNKGLTETPTDTCESGLIHGLLYGYAEVVSSTEEYLSETVPFCARLAASSGYAQDRCLHGIGHGVALLSGGNIMSALDSCDTLSGTDGHFQCTGAVVMEFGEDRLNAIGWSISHSDENSTERLTVDEDQVGTVCEGRAATCLERYWMLLLPPRSEVSGFEDGPLAHKTCSRFSKGYEQELCLTGFGHLAGALWWIFDFEDGATLPPDSPAEADLAAQRAVKRCSTHPSLGMCLMGLIPGSVSPWYRANLPHIPDFCRYVPEEDLNQCKVATEAAKKG